ncbi:MAG: cupredoxin domain-containing protein [Parcubacteria group bacterium]|nr:cupredoxin domain-containing protein [Parcubacteria group bacterium]
MNKTILFIIVLAVVFSGVIWFLGKRGNETVSLQPTPPLSGENETLSVSPTQPAQSPTTLTFSPAPTDVPVQPGFIPPKTVTVNMTDSGFNPAEVTINAGDTVKFVNQGDQSHWPASAVHPVHELYPGSGISKCGTDQALFIFDACRGLSRGESFSFTFNAKGSWPYHDHLNPSLKGKIIVQ